MNGGRVRDAHRPEPKCLSSTGELIDIERVTISLEGGRWKSTHRGNSLAAYPTARPVLNGLRHEVADVLVVPQYARTQPSVLPLVRYRAMRSWEHGGVKC